MKLQTNTPHEYRHKKSLQSISRLDLAKLKSLDTS